MRRLHVPEEIICKKKGFLCEAKLGESTVVLQIRLDIERKFAVLDSRKGLEATFFLLGAGCNPKGMLAGFLHYYFYYFI